MPSDYVSIRADNEREYGLGVERWGKTVLAERYDDASHFIFELLQNAEDALARRPSTQGSRAVHFALSRNSLRVSHFGKPFDERDVRGVCGIAQTTKDLTAIGRFGIGFKSVYAVTDRPEIHSGDEDFAIESFVWPVAAPHLEREPGETVIVLPLKDTGTGFYGRLSKGLERLGSGALRFLREIEEISWSVDSGPSGLYLRNPADQIEANVRRIALIGQEDNKPAVEENWLILSRNASRNRRESPGQIEIAFSITPGKAANQWSIRPVRDSRLVVFFPTMLKTELGFLVQGPYRTTPSRDNVPIDDPWNQSLVRNTAALLVDALRWLRDHNMLDTAVLGCLPLDRDEFSPESRFAPLYEATREALTREPLLPRAGGGFTRANTAKLARTQELRELFDSTQLAALFGIDGEVAWLSGDISADRTPALRQYLMREHAISEVTPDTILPKLDKSFLEAQSDDWVLKLYQFLSGQQALRWQLANLPLIRLESGAHVVARVNGQPQAFLPSALSTTFPTVRRSVCITGKSREFLQALGLTEPDPVDDVIQNVLPKYDADDFDILKQEYEADIRRILEAYQTDSKVQRDKLLTALRSCPFVMAVDAGDGSKRLNSPDQVYLDTDRLKRLFGRVAEVLLVDDSLSCLHGDAAREMLEACGVARCLRPIKAPTALTWEERKVLREEAGHPATSGQNDSIADYGLLGLEALLALLPKLPPADRVERSRLLWDSLGDLEERRGRGVFEGTYAWTHYGSYERRFPSAFARQLNATAWVAAQSGDLHRSEALFFDTLGWEPNPFLLSKIHFKPPIIETLAKEAGIEPGVLDLLKRLGVTSEAALKTKLGIQDVRDEPSGAPGSPQVEDALKHLLGDAPQPTQTADYVKNPELLELEARSGVSGERIELSTQARRDLSAGSTHAAQTDGRVRGQGQTSDRQPSGSPAGREFISYVTAHPTDDPPDPDGLDHQTRMILEQRAIELILASEPALRRTPANNPGYDLFETDPDGQVVRWIEIKAMTGGLNDRPVGLSHTQFAFARERQQAYWLYVVEHVNNARTRIVRIQNPAGRARTFTFDAGWLDVADVADIDMEPEDGDDQA